MLWVLAYRFVNPPITATMLGDIVAGRGATRDWMSIEQIDRDMVRAAIGAEDSKFCTHNGFDLEAIEDAMKRNASGGRIRGGSTISQQTAKNAFLWQGGGYFRKGLEAWFTLLIEKLWPKRRIMEVYLNLAETGIGTYGVNAGSQRYFGHDASAMSRPRRRGSPPSCRCPRSAVPSRPRASPAATAIRSARGSAWSPATGWTPAFTKTSFRRRKRLRRRAKAPKALPGEEYESAKPLPPLNEVVEELPIIAVEPEAPTTQAAPDPDPSLPDANVAPPPATTEETPPEPVQ